jgi:3-dehydroquinate dehydratase-2
MASPIPTNPPHAIKKMQIGILNGPNLNLLGRREPEIYGERPFEPYLFELRSLFPHTELFYKQSNHEGDLIDQLHDWGFSLDGVICNAGAYTHTSIALADAVRAIPAPVIEIHLTDLNQREAYRQTSYMRSFCVHSIMGKGLRGYAEAVQYLLER